MVQLPWERLLFAAVLRGWRFFPRSEFAIVLSGEREREREMLSEGRKRLFESLESFFRCVWF